MPHVAIVESATTLVNDLNRLRSSMDAFADRSGFSRAPKNGMGSWPTNFFACHKQLQNKRLRPKSCVPIPVAIELAMETPSGCLEMSILLIQKI
jgi:hypothetical protein